MTRSSTGRTVCSTPSSRHSRTFELRHVFCFGVSFAFNGFWQSTWLKLSECASFRDTSDLSAVCVYRVSDISRVFAEGNYKTPLTVETSFVKWVMYSGDVPFPRPGTVSMTPMQCVNKDKAENATFFNEWLRRRFFLSSDSLVLFLPSSLSPFLPLVYRQRGSSSWHN